MGKQVDARINGGVAQLGEHLPCKQGVKSSNLSVSTSNCFAITIVALKSNDKNCSLKTSYMIRELIKYL